MPSARTSLGIFFSSSKLCYLGRTLKLSAGAGQGNKASVQRTWVKSGSELLFLSGEWTGKRVNLSLVPRSPSGDWGYRELDI